MYTSMLNSPAEVSKIVVAIMQHGVAGSKGRMTTTYRYPYSGGTVRLLSRILNGERVHHLKCKQWSFDLMPSFTNPRIENIWGDPNQIDDFLMLVLMSH